MAVEHTHQQTLPASRAGSEMTLSNDDTNMFVPEEKTSSPTREERGLDTMPPPSSPSDKKLEEQPVQKPPGSVMPPVPNGGAVAWVHVLGGFMLFFNTWGILNTFGVYQTFYEEGSLFTSSSSNISWVGSIQAYMVLLVGFFSGPIYDRGYFKSLVIVGSFGVVFGHMMLSISDKYYQVLLSQGFVVGIGAGCLFIPGVAILPTYFNTRLGLAIGLAAAGSSMGGVIYPIVFYRLLYVNGLSFGWSTRIIGFIALVTLLIPIFCMRMRFKPPKPRALIDWTAFVDAQFMTFTIGTLIGFIGLYIMFFYISFYAQEQRITDAAMSFYIVPIFNAASTFGRTLPNALSDITGPLNLIAPGGIVVGILLFSMLAVHTEAAIIVVAILFGFFSGVFIALPPVAFVALTPDKSKIGTRIGMGFGLIGFGALIGGPGAGGVLGHTAPLNWTGVWVLGGVTTLIAGLLFIVLRVWRGGFKLKVKV